MSMYSEAEKIYRALGVDVDAAFRRVAEIPVSLHCWQGDDVAGFENSGSLDGGLAVTGNYPGRARTPGELRADIDKVLSLVPGTKRLNIHAIYAEFDGKKVDRNELTVDNFKNWMDWSKANNVALDFNPTFFAHPMAADGFTLSNASDEVRKFWIEHGIACRKIAAEFGRAAPVSPTSGLPMVLRILPSTAKLPAAASRNLWMLFLQWMLTKSTTAMLWKANFSVSVPKAVRSVRTSSTWAIA